MRDIMIATVTLNPCLDEHITVDNLVVNEANRRVKLRRYAGGKGIDVSRAINEMDGNTIAYGFIGGEHGRELEIFLDEEGVLFSFTPIKHDIRTNLIITDASTGLQRRISSTGPRICKSELQRFFRRLGRIHPRPDIVVVGGSVPPGLPASIYQDIIRQFEAEGVRVILDTADQWLAEGIKAKPYLIKPNVHEAQALLGRELTSEEDIVQAALDLVASGIEVAVISRGEEGLITATCECVVKAVPPRVKVRSTVGAGDCTVAGFALKLAQGESLVEACRLAVAMGTAAVTTQGTELCHKEDVEKMLPRVTVEEITSCWQHREFAHPASLDLSPA